MYRCCMQHRIWRWKIIAFFLYHQIVDTLLTSVNIALSTQHEKLCCINKGKGKTGICAVQCEQACGCNLCNASNESLLRCWGLFLTSLHLYVPSQTLISTWVMPSAVSLLLSVHQIWNLSIRDQLCVTVAIKMETYFVRP